MDFQEFFILPQIMEWYHSLWLYGILSRTYMGSNLGLKLEERLGKVKLGERLGEVCEAATFKKNYRTIIIK